MNCNLRDGKSYPEHLARVVVIYNFATNDYEEFVECTRCGKKSDSTIIKVFEPLDDKAKALYIDILNNI